MQGCGCLLAVVSLVGGFFYWPLWILTVAGVLLFALSGRR